MISIRMDYDARIGPTEQDRREMTNILPVTPFRIGDRWSLVVRTITPVVGQHEVFPGAGSQFGLADTP